MARIALLDPRRRSGPTVEALLGRAHRLVRCDSLTATADADLMLIDVVPGQFDDPEAATGLGQAVPALLLIDGRCQLPASVREGERLGVLRKPFDPFQLRLKVDALLAASRSTPGEETRQARAAALPLGEDSAWLEFPFVPAPAGAMLRRAVRLDAPLWLLGEQGCGRHRLAVAVSRLAVPPLPVVTWMGEEHLDSLLSRQGDRRFALVVAEVQERSMLEQERLAAEVSVGSTFRLVATSRNDVAEDVVEGRFSRKLYYQLSGLAVQISPLRERPLAVPPLVETLSARIGGELGIEDVAYTPEALAKLQTYMWPGNIIELEAVLNRTFASLAEIDGGVLIDAGDLMFTSEDTRRAGPRPEDLGTGRIDEPSVLPVAGERDPGEPALSPADVGFEHVVAQLAHDLKNPMVTIKSFAGVVSSGSADMESAKELGGLAGEACDRIDGYLEALLEFGGFGMPSPRTVDLAEVMERAIGELDMDDGPKAEFEAGGSMEVLCDAEQLCFVVENLIEAVVAEHPVRRPLLFRRVGTTGIRVEVALGEGPAAKLRKLVEAGPRSLSWRLLLARNVAERNGGSIKMEFSADTMTVLCVLPEAKESGHGKQTESTNS